MEQQVATSPFAEEQENMPDMEEGVLPESPFADDIEESEGEISDVEEDLESDDSVTDEEESDEESDEELTDEELEEILKELEEEEEADEPVDTVPHAALHKERERRKELQQQYSMLEQQANAVAELTKTYKEQLDSIKRQVKEMGLEDVLDIKVEEPSPEIIEYRMKQQQEQQQQQIVQTVNALRQEAMNHVDEFPAIDPKDETQGELVLGYALAAVAFGEDMEEAVMRGMKILNDRIIQERKSSTRKPVRKRPSPAPRKVRNPQGSQKLAKGDLKGFFRDTAGQMLSE